MFHDSSPHLSRLVALDTGLKEGVFPPMWAKNMMGGIGSPVLMLTYQFPYYLMELWVKLGITMQDSYKLTLGLSLLLSGIVMYFALRHRFGRITSLSASMIYLLAPYRMVDILVRGAVGEALAFVFVPMILLGLYRKSFYWILFGWIGLILTHPLASAIFAIFYPLYILFLYKKRERKIIFIKYLTAFIFSILLSSFNLVPTLLLTGFTHYSPALSNPTEHFPTFFQLISSKWGWGASMPGNGDYMSFSLGLIQIITVVAFIVYFFDKWQMGIKPGREKIFLGGSLLLGILLMLPISSGVYSILFLSNFIDYPWRLLFLFVFLISVISALLMHKLKSKYQYLVGVSVIIILTIQTLPISIKHPDYWTQDLSFFEYDTGDDKGEYVPIYRNTRFKFDFEETINVIDGKAEVEKIQELSHLREYKINAIKDSVIRINSTYFPGWKIFIDGEETNIQMPQALRPSEGCYITKKSEIETDDSGFIACNLVKGEYGIKYQYKMTNQQKAGNLITLFGILLLLVYGIIWNRKKDD